MLLWFNYQDKASFVDLAQEEPGSAHRRYLRSDQMCIDLRVYGHSPIVCDRVSGGEFTEGGINSFTFEFLRYAHDASVIRCLHEAAGMGMIHMVFQPLVSKGLRVGSPLIYSGVIASLELNSYDANSSHMSFMSVTVAGVQLEL